jgi:hypothetical protein
MAGSADDKARERLIGTWTLISAVRQEIPSGAMTDLFGADPQGYLATRSGTSGSTKTG